MERGLNPLFSGGMGSLRIVLDSVVELKSLGPNVFCRTVESVGLGEFEGPDVLGESEFFGGLVELVGGLMG